MLTTPLHAGTVTFSYEEALKRSWKHEVLSFLVYVPELGNHPAAMYVTDETGAVIPAQVSASAASFKAEQVPLTVSVVADYEPWQKHTWTLHFDEDTKPALPPTDLTSKEEKDSYVLANSLVAIRTGRGEGRFTEPVDAGSVPAPLLAVRGRSGAWLGRGWLETPQRVVSYQIALTDDGPIFKRVRATYRFEEGYYTCTIALRTGEDVVHLREEFDLGDPSPARDSNFCFSLYEGLRPDTVRWVGWYFGDKRFNVNDARWLDPSREACFPVDYEHPEPLLRLHGLFPWWQQAASYFGVYRQDTPQGDLIAAFPERPGHWSNPTVIFLESRNGPDLVMKAPIRLPVPQGTVDGVEHRSPYMTGTMDPGTPPTRGIREWGLLVSRPADAIAADGSVTQSGIRRAWTRYGQNPLDKIKDWTLQWEAPGPDSYPRGFIAAADLPALRERVKADPRLSAMLSDNTKRRFAYLVTQGAALGDRLLHDTANGDSNWMGILPKLRFYAARYLDTDGDIGASTHMHRAAGMLMQAAPLFDVAMSIPSMTPDERREANALYAFLVYKLADRDYLAYGTGFHLGNVNMPTMAMNVIGYSAALIPEHPMGYEWVMMSAKGTLAMLRDYTAPGGAWRECPHYQMDASMYGVMQSADVFRNVGFLDLYRNASFKSTMLYHLKLLTPVDPRFGIRTMPAIGNGCHESTSLYGRMAAGTATSDPEYSRWMQWGWNAVGMHLQYPNDEALCNQRLAASPPDMCSQHFPGFGAVMRSHFGDPNETYLVFRMGFQHEHYEDDQGNILLYAKGAPLVLDFASLYEPAMVRAWMHNCVAFDRMLSWTALGEITQQNFLDAADACLGSKTVSTLQKYPDDPKDNPPPNRQPETKTISPVTWTRQVMLVKHELADGPHYVLVRDGFAGKGDEFTEFSLWCLATGVETRGNVAHYPGQHGVDLTVTMLDPSQPEFTTGKYGHHFLYEGFCGPYFRKVNGPDAKWEEVQHFVRAKRTDHKGYFAVLYPHRAGEVAPAFTAWAGGAGVSATINGEKQIAICAEQAGQYSDGDVSVDGQRALVRDDNGRLVLALLSGTRLQAFGYELCTPGPASIAIEGAQITGEANLLAPGELRLTVPKGIKVSTCRVVTDTGEHQVALVQDGDALGIPLPSGRCRFALR